MSNHIIDRFALFSGNERGIESWLTKETDPRVFKCLATIDSDPISRSQLNQLLLLGHEAAMSEGFFRYYWLEVPATSTHPYKLDTIEGYSADFKDRNAISSIEHLRWGLYRLYVDGLLYYGNVREAYRQLRAMSFDEISHQQKRRCFDFNSKFGLLHRGAPLTLSQIPKDDRYLISEMACKSYAPAEGKDDSLLDTLTATYKTLSKGRRTRSFTVKELIHGGNAQSRQMELEFSASEFLDEKITSVAGLKKHARYKMRFDAARTAALENTQTYLSMVNDLDVYVATSMRTRDDFRRMAERCAAIFGDKRLQDLDLRYFDPTVSAAPCHEDKGLIECLMVKCAKVLIYMAEEKESYGKDAEAAMALSLGKPVIFLCDEEQRSRFYKDVHPLSRLIDFKSGVAVGSIVTSRTDLVPLILERLFSNAMEYELFRAQNGYLHLKEKITDSIVRVQTNDRLLRETFWNHYHNPV